MSAVDILAAIETAFDEREPVKVNVPEWGGVDLYFQPDLTVAQQKQIRAGINANDEGALMASFIIHQALDAEGKRVFEANAKTRATLESKAGLRVLTRILSEIGEPETQEAVKNG